MKKLSKWSSRGSNSQERRYVSWQVIDVTKHPIMSICHFKETPILVCFALLDPGIQKYDRKDPSCLVH